MTTAPDPIDANTAAYQAWLATPEGQAAVNAPAPVPAATPDAVAAAPATDASSTAPAPSPAAPAAATTPTAPAPTAPDLFPADVPVTPEAVAAATPPPAPGPVLKAGDLVCHTFTTVYDGEVSRYGVVLGYDTSGDVPVARIGWLEGPSGPIPASDLVTI